MIRPSEEPTPHPPPHGPPGPFRATDSRKLRPFVILPVLFFLLLVSLALLANSLIQKPSVQKAILDRLTEVTGHEIAVDQIELYLWKGLGIKVYDFDARQRGGFGRIRASEAVVFMDVLQLLRGRVLPKRLHVERPIIDLNLPEERDHRQSRLDQKLLSLLVIPELESLTMEKGALFIRHFPLRLVNLSLEMKKAEAEILNVRCQGEAKQRGESTSFRLQGGITLGQGKDERASAHFTFKTGKTPLRWIPFPEAIPVRNGTCEAQLTIELKSREPANVSGKLLVESALFSVKEKGRTKEYSMKSMTFDFRSFLERGIIHVPHLDFKTPDASFSLTLRLDLRERENPYLRLEAKSLPMAYSSVETLFPAPLVAPWVERDLFPLLRSGNVLLESFLIDGNFLQLKNLELAENRSVLSMGFDCKSFTIHGNRLREPFREVSGKVLLKDGVLLVSSLKGVSGKSEIREGLLKVRGIFHPYPVFEPWVRGSFDMEDVLHQCKADFLPAQFKETIENLETASGTVDGQAGFRYGTRMETLEITEADLLLRGGAFKHRHWPFPLIVKEGRFKIGVGNGTESRAIEDGDNLRAESRGRFQGSGSWGTSSFEAESGFSLQGLSVDPRWVEGVARLDLGQFWSVTFPNLNPGLFKGSAVCRISMRRNADQWSVEGTASMGPSSVDHELFVIDPPGDAGLLTFHLDLLPAKQIRMKQLLWKAGKSSLTLSGGFPLSPEGDITLQCSAQALSFKDLGLRVKRGGFVSSGSLEGALQARIPKKDFSAATVSGEVKGENLSFHPAALPSPVRDCDFRALLSGDKIVIPSLTLKTGETSLKANGELRGWKGLKGAFTATLNPLDLSDFISPSKDGQQKKEPSAFAENTNIRVSLDAQLAQWKRIVSESLKAELLFTGNDFHIISSQIRVDRGALEVSGYVKDEAMAFSGRVEFKDQPMEVLLKRLGIEPVYEGSLTMEAQLYTEGKTLGDLISHLDGRTNVLIEKGVIRKSNVFLQVLEFLSLQAIFTKRPPDISKEGLYFESLGGHGHIEKGVVRTENAQMKGPVINAVAIGSADLGQSLADFDLGVQPLGTIDTVVSKIPILGHILTGEGKSLITYYFEVKGPITDPRVEHVPFKTVGEGVAGILKRLFLSPVKLFEDLSDGIKQLPAPENGQSPSTQHFGH